MRVVYLDRQAPSSIGLREPDVLTPLIGEYDYVYHLADVVAGIGYVSDNEGSVFRQNLVINSNVIAAVRTNPALRGFVCVGTACSFPAHLQTGQDARPLVEDDQYPAAPESAYGWSKLMGEYESSLLEMETGIPVSLPVLHNVYGTPCDFSEATSQVIPSLARKAARYPEEPFVVWGDGLQARAFVHVDDVVDGLLVAMEKGLGRGAIQLGLDTCTTIREIAETIVAVSGKAIDIQYDASKPQGDKGRCADYSKAQRVLGWTPSTPLREGLTEAYAWVEEQIRASAC